MIERAQIDVFIDSLKRYFRHLDGVASGPANKLEIGAPYLLRDAQTMGLGYTGMINVSGTQSGTVFVSAGSTLLKRILLSYGEHNLSSEHKRDLIGEVANTLAGNARRHLGAEFHISTPRVLEGPIDPKRFDLNDRCFTLPFRWRSNKAELIVSINSAKPLLELI